MHRLASLRAFTLALTLGLAATTAAEPVVILAPEGANLAGRIQYERAPGGSAGAMKMVDQRLPQPTVRVGPTGNNNIGLGFLLGFPLDDVARAALTTGARAELVLDVHSSALGGAPSALQVVRLETAGATTPESYSWFGAWNNARHLSPVGQIDADPDLGPQRFDVTALLPAAQLSSAAPVVYFAVFSPVADLATASAGQHVLFIAQGPSRPRLVLTPNP